MTSIRRHLTLRLVITTSLLGACGVLAAYVYLRKELSRQFDDHLLSRARTLASLVHAEDEHSRVQFELNGDRSPSEQRVAKRLGFFEIWEQNGDVLAKSDSLKSIDLPHPTVADLDVDVGESHFYDLELPDGRPGRGVVYVVTPWIERSSTPAPPVAANSGPPPDVKPVTLVLATDIRDLHRTLRDAMVGFLVIFSALAAATLITVVSTVRRGMRPLNEIGDAAERIDPATLGERFDVSKLPVELRPVGEKLNELLSRLDDAFRRERRFNANVAHELRTPIAELRSLAEVAIQWPPADAESTSASFGDVLAVARQMESVVSALLAIARCQAGQESLAFRPVALDEVIAEAWRPFAAKARERRLNVDLCTTPALVETDRTVLIVVLRNLFGNAAAYTQTGGRVWCEVQTRGERCVLALLNTNDSLSAKDLPLLTEPFWRKDASRGTSSDNAGLGLSLVSAYANLLHAQFDTTLRTPDTFAVTLDLPIAHGPMPATLREAPPADVAKLAPANMIAP
jgi:two-component system sensor histidine kinase QseC